MATDTNEMLEKLDNQIAQLKARKKQIANKEKQKVKREKTRLLIEYGELVEKYLKFETPAELENILAKFNRDKNKDDTHSDLDALFDIDFNMDDINKIT